MNLQHNSDGLIWDADIPRDDADGITRNAVCAVQCRHIADDGPTARLFCAAPELLGACRSALRALRDNLQPGPMDEGAIRGIEDAIAKATGKLTA